MRLILFTLLMFSAYIMPVSKAYALDQVEEYKKIAQEIMDAESTGEIPKGINFTNLKLFYVSTPQYDPLSETVGLLKSIAQELENAQTNNKKLTLARLYKNVVIDHMANFAIVNQAWKDAKNNAYFGFHEFWNSLRSALFFNLVGSGTGAGYRSAYDIFTIDEEVYLLAHLNVDVLDTLTHKVGAHTYNIHSVRDKNTNEVRELYVNVTIPVGILKLRSQRQSNTASEPFLKP